MASLRVIFLAIAAAALLATAACDNNGCEENSSSLPLAGFYSSQTKSAISVDSLTVYGIGSPGDSAIISCSSASQVYLPFDVDTTACSFVFRYEQADIAQYGIADTVSIAYSCEPYFHSYDCGAMYNFKITGYSTTTNLIDSVEFPYPTITNANVENIHVYFRTEEADAE